MRRPLIALALSLVALCLQAKPQVKLTTTLGTIVMELEPDAAPKTVENFLRYVKKGQYKGTIFHRVIPGFMIQGGGYVDYLGKKRTDAPIPNEADRALAAGLKNKRGTVAMARTPDPHSAAAEFFINVVDNPALDFKGKANDKTWGYCVFGKVIKGMDVVDRIKAVKTSNKRSDFLNLPVQAIVITDAAQVQ
ncbi:peptidylprolyl isomerase [Geothrix sp. 21YS21S-4]|uniref:peptidylprolyl isomerase n=1 Tax=Geothrix sp. 21YS21S-4 TaxID=3068889 RepID=UPI0027B9505E|nr:peptidylprolyl isomerase [Geothrix sp. 21YS21S-4]